MRNAVLVLVSFVFVAAASGCDAGAFPMPSMPDLQGARPQATEASAQGVRCELAGEDASIAFEGKSLSFTCESSEEKEVGLVGEIRPTDAGWTIERITLTHDESGTAVQDSEMVVIAQVELENGTVCSSTGTGATAAFEGKRLNYTCASAVESGLIGDVEVTEEGWMIEQAFLGHGAEGLQMQSSELVPIAALVVFSSD